MSKIIELRLSNFKRFESLKMAFDPEINILVGDNESGKSTILLAMDLTLAASRGKVETLGIQNLFNQDSIEDFLASPKREIINLPEMCVEIFLEDQNNADLNGECYNNPQGNRDGLRMSCEPMLEHSRDIKEVLDENVDNFPFEFYSIHFRTFSGETVSGYRKYLSHLLLDNSETSSEYAARSYVNSVYGSHAGDVVRHRNANSYRDQKREFAKQYLVPLTDNTKKYEFGLKTDRSSRLEGDLTILEDSIPIEHKGKGRQALVKTEFAISKKAKKQAIDVILVEEPENHLSHVNMLKLVATIRAAAGQQVFVTTHNSLISTRLGLQKTILLGGKNGLVQGLRELPPDTADFFVKAANNNILEFALSDRVVLVEGDAEFILFDAFFKKITGKPASDNGIHVIAIGGTSFKRYLDLAIPLGIRTAVVTDNDTKPEATCVKKYEDHIADNVKVFFDPDPALHTFEVCLYDVNEKLCNELFKPGRKSRTVLQYMLSEKTESAYRLLVEYSDSLEPPEYIRDALTWIIK